MATQMHCVQWKNKLRIQMHKIQYQQKSMKPWISGISLHGSYCHLVNVTADQQALPYTLTQSQWSIQFLLPVIPCHGCYSPVVGELQSQPISLGFVACESIRSSSRTWACWPEVIPFGGLVLLVGVCFLALKGLDLPAENGIPRYCNKKTSPQNTQLPQIITLLDEKIKGGL